MKKLIAIIFCILTVLSGCTNRTYSHNETDDTQIVVLPDESTAATVNGYKITNNESEQTKENNKNSSPDETKETEIKKETEENSESEKPAETNKNQTEYIANSSTKKFHKSTCTYAKKIKDENKLESNDRSELISEGYEPCKKCNP